MDGARIVLPKNGVIPLAGSWRRLTLQGTRAAAIDAVFSTILRLIAARRCLTNPDSANSRFAIYGEKAFLILDALLRIGALGARTTAVDIGFVGVFCAIPASGRKTCAHVARTFAIGVRRACFAVLTRETIHTAAINVRLRAVHRAVYACGNQASIFDANIRGTLVGHRAFDAFEFGGASAHRVPGRRAGLRRWHRIGRGIAIVFVALVRPIVGINRGIAGNQLDVTLAIANAGLAITVKLGGDFVAILIEVPDAKTSRARRRRLALGGNAIGKLGAFDGITTRTTHTAGRRSRTAFATHTAGAAGTAGPRHIVEYLIFDARHRCECTNKRKRNDQEPRDSLHRRLLPTLLDAAQRTEGLSGHKTSNSHTDEMHDDHERPPCTELARAHRRNTDATMVANTVSERESSGKIASTS